MELQVPLLGQFLDNLMSSHWALDWQIPLGYVEEIVEQRGSLALRVNCDPFAVLARISRTAARFNF
jgi:hypothetical protein